MLRIASEVRLWKPLDVSDLLADAAKLVDGLELPDELRVEAFRQACSMLGQKNVQLEQVAIGAPTMAVPRGLG